MLHAECSKQIKAEDARLQKANERLSEREDTANARLADLKSTHATKITPEQRADAVTLKDELFAIDQDRIPFKMERIAFREGPLLDDLQAIASRKAEGPAQAEAEIRKRLVGIGYFDVHESEYGAIRPMFVLVHPLYRKALQEADDAGAAIQQNDAMLRADRESLEEDLARLEVKKLKLFSF